jgi:hypothetical protein
MMTSSEIYKTMGLQNGIRVNPLAGEIKLSKIFKKDPEEDLEIAKR